MKNGTISVSFAGKSISAIPFNCWPPRGDNLVIMIKKAFSKFSSNAIRKMKPFKTIFDINDWGDGNFSIASDKYSEKSIPCFSFINWMQGNIDDYTKVCLEISNAGNLEPKIDKVFWKGFLSHPTRKIFIEKYKNHPKVSASECNVMWGHMHKDNPAYNRPEIIKSNYTSLPDHCKYKYLIDMQGMGGGYSARVKFLMHSKRPIFYQKRKLHEYWFWDLSPFVHYIPVEEDFSDFEEKLNWAERNQEKCKEIANNAFNFALNNLKKEDAISRMKSILYRLGTGEMK